MGKMDRYQYRSYEDPCFLQGLCCITVQLFAELLFVDSRKREFGFSSLSIKLCPLPIKSNPQKTRKCKEQILRMKNPGQEDFLKDVSMPCAAAVSGMLSI